MKRTVCSLFCLAALILMHAPAAYGTDFDVSDAAALRAALVEAGSNGLDDTITVNPGTYNVTTPLDYTENPPGQNLSIIGAGAATTILDGGLVTQVMHLAMDTGLVTLSGVTIRNGIDSSFGAGLNGTNTPGGTFTISDSTISGNNSSGDAGGFQFVGGGNLVISNSTISGNTAASVGGGGVIDANDVTITNSTISGNSAQNEGGLQIFATTLSVTNSTFSNNTIAPDNSGAGFVAFPDSTAVFTGNTISGNTVVGPCAGGDNGVAFQIYTTGPLTFTRNFVDSNTTTCPSFAIADIYHFGPGTDTVTVADNIFSGNTSGPGSLTSPISIVSDDGTVNVANNTFTGNDSGTAGLSDVVLGVNFNGAVLNVSNNIFFSDSLELDNGGGAATATFRNNIIDPANGTVGPGITMSGNFNADPLFVDGPGGDFHITGTSPAIDAGLPMAPGAQGFDFDGDLRPLGSGTDVGADEYRAPPTYDPIASTLVIDEVQLTTGGNIRPAYARTKAFSIVLNRLPEAGIVFELDAASLQRADVSSNPGGTYNVLTGVLSLFNVKVTKNKFFDVTFTKRPGVFIFDLATIDPRQ